MRKLIILISIVLFTSCFDHARELPDSETPLRLSIYANFDNKTDSLFLRVNSTYVINEAKPKLDSSLIEAHLIAPDGQIFTFSPYTGPSRTKFKSKRVETHFLDNIPDFVPNENYTLNVSYPGYESIWSETYMPKPVRLTHYEHSFGESRVSFKFKDPPGKNFYRLGLSGFAADVIEDPDIQEFYGRARLMDDETFEEETVAVSFTYWQKISNINTKDFSFLCITEESFNYWKNLYLFQESQRNPFIGEIIVPTNIENGLGIFAINNRTDYE